MKMERKKLRIGDLAQSIDVECFVIRFWEREFNLLPKRSSGGQRYYTKKDLKIFQRIKHLLYKEGYTIEGAKQQLKKNTKQEIDLVASQKTNFDVNLHQTIISNEKADDKHKDVSKKIIILQKKLIKLKSLLS